MARGRALTLQLFWRRSTVSPVFFGRYPRSSIHSPPPPPPPATHPQSLISHLASVDVKQNVLASGGQWDFGVSHRDYIWPNILVGFCMHHTFNIGHESCALASPRDKIKQAVGNRVRPAATFDTRVCSHGRSPANRH